GGRRQAPVVFLDNEDHGQLPDRSQVHGLVDVTLAGGAVADQRDRDPLLAAQLGRQREARRDREHGADVADHAHHPVVEVAEVEGGVAAPGEAAAAAEELAATTGQVELAPAEHPEVAVTGQDPVVVLQRGDDADRDGLLPDAREPLGQVASAQQRQHLVLDQAGEEQAPVEADQILVVGYRGQLVHRDRSSSTCFSTSGTSVMMPSTPSSRSWPIWTESLMVHTGTGSPLTCAASRKRAVTSGTRPRRVGTCTQAAVNRLAGMPRDA